MPISRRVTRDRENGIEACFTIAEVRQLLTAYVLALVWSFMIYARMSADALVGILFDAKMRKNVSVKDVSRRFRAQFSSEIKQ